jgi:hypothetical protein
MCITLNVRIIIKYTLGRISIHTNGSNNICVNHARKWNMTLIWTKQSIKHLSWLFCIQICISTRLIKWKTITFNILIIILVHVIIMLKVNLHHTKSIGIWKGTIWYVNVEVICCDFWTTKEKILPSLLLCIIFHRGIN